MDRKSRSLLVICLFGCFLTVASMFMPWWSSRAYGPGDDVPHAKQSLYILPPQYLMESQRLVVYYEVSLRGNIALTAKILTILHILTANIAIFGMIIIHSLEKNSAGGIIISASGALCLLSPLIFYLILPQALWPWFEKISETRTYHSLPFGFETAWGLTYGYFSTIIACVLLIIGGATLFLTHEQT